MQRSFHSPKHRFSSDDRRGKSLHLIISPIQTAAMNLALILLLSLLSSITLCSSVLALIPIIGNYYPIERDALLQLRDSVASPKLHSNWTGPPCMNNQSRWGGIACSDGHVVRLVLDGIQLTGSLPPAFLQNISFLTKLSLRNNSAFGPLPSLTNLIQLEYVFLSHNLFTDSIPFDYIQLPNLKKIELQQNYLQGEIPPFNQQNLVAFNVSYNSLQGPIPQTDVLQRFPESSYQHNSGLCGNPLEKKCPVPPNPSITPTPSPPDSSKKSFEARNLALIVAASVLVPFVVIFVFLCYYKRVQRKETTKRKKAARILFHSESSASVKSTPSYLAQYIGIILGENAVQFDIFLPFSYFPPQTGDTSIELAEKKMSSSQSTEDPERTVELEFFDKNIPVFDLEDLLRASAEVLGKGKLSTTYKATLESGLVVAVKRIKSMNSLSKKEFVQQMQLLGKLRHENLAQIISFYNSKDEKLIIYEFVPNGNLFELLHENRGAGRVPLNWTTRLAIIKGVAMGMNFLHQYLSSHKVPHANLKSSNVLIHRQSQNYHSKVTDFGYYPLLPSRKSLERLAIARSPEFSQAKKLTHKADVYCFGIILLEIITGRIPGDEISEGNHDKRADGLSEWVTAVVNNDWSTDILDVEIVATREAHDEMLKFTELALECTDVAPEKRPKMSQVLRRIQEIEQRSSESH
ncbi:Leucine-rich repeat transmembrane protein kinase family protein, putative [Theobroma cacao]|uniref:Leucine-rich repeat transmembrane protein kinase family protein, putative n=1 Tax=Theobroma cacao TaxID=3641 RepID=A0A061FY50_THECC|nr:Leucine-rich repeat transmembrane protein kinase family protein, putative [Theobroma cacao]